MVINGWTQIKCHFNLSQLFSEKSTGCYPIHGKYSLKPFKNVNKISEKKAFVSKKMPLSSMTDVL